MNQDTDVPEQLVSKVGSLDQHDPGLRRQSVKITAVDDEARRQLFSRKSRKVANTGEKPDSTAVPSPQLLAEATISRDLTDGKVSQEVVLLKALGARYGVTVSLPELTQPKSTPVPMNRESTKSMPHELHQSGPDESSKFHSGDEASREAGVSLHTPTKSTTIQFSKTGRSSAPSTPQHQLPRPQPLQDKKPPSEKKSNESSGLKVFNGARVKQDHSSASHGIENSNRATSLLDFTTQCPEGSSACKDPPIETSTLYADNPAFSDDFAAFLLSSYENLSETRSEHYRLEASHHYSKKPSLLHRDTRLQESELPPAEFPPLQRSSSLAGWKAQSSNAEWKISEVMEDLERQNTLLEQECSRLRRIARETQLPTTCVLHKVYCHARGHNAVTTDLPSRFGGSTHLDGQEHVLDTRVFVAERKPNLAFLIYKNYLCCTELNDPRFEPDTVEIISPKFAQYFTELTQNLQKTNRFFPKFEPKTSLDAPFYWYYHCLPQLLTETSKLSEEAKTFVNLFHNYIWRDFGNLYKTVASDFRDGVVSCDHVPFLFTPGSILSWDNGKSTETGSLKSWPSFLTYDDGPVFTVWSWNFDGNFCKSSRDIFHDHSSAFLGKAEGERIPITSLPCFPIRYASADARADLRIWGETFWKCRKRKFVTYNGWDSKREEWNIDARYMVDLATFYKMHPDKHPNKRLENELAPEVMDGDEPPKGDFVLLLPRSVRGFHLLEKKWVDLDVSGISEIEWNKEAFKSLAIEKDTKTLITALVTNKIAADRSTDLIEGKGSGLMILLHGGPGTGKTLTAESVAELAEKPLYRVTCGDIGTNPDSVEKYLNTVLVLSKTWDCVVLLDEADVFLEQRTLTDLQRNALVSVFLRVLEYYDGILILTSNRVGTFDEAFKSRIQLALHYEGLNGEQRRKIWGNFINRLETLDNKQNAPKGAEASPGVDTHSLREHIDELARFKLNGREIRNAVTTARQLALYHGKSMDYKDIVHVIGVIGKFNQYLIDVNEGTTDEVIMRDDRVR